MIPASWRSGEVAVVGLGRSGLAAARFLARQGIRVYASDCADTEGIAAARDELERAGVAVDSGAHDLDRIKRSVAVITSPGIPPYAPPLSAARGAGREILAELDLAAMMLPDAKLVVVTGTNGKTTTTAAVAHLLESAGLNAVAAGNIGLPLIEVAAGTPHPDWVAVEASSFQLHDAPHLEPTVGVLTNLSPDHQDRYADAAAYYADKRKLFDNASSDSVWVLNGDDVAVMDLARDVPGTRCLWSLNEPSDGWYDRRTARLLLFGEPLLDRADLALLGDHNVANSLAAALAATAAGVPKDRIAAGLRSFRPLHHRLEPVREVGGVLWVNDSKATNVASTAVAVAAMERPFILIAGGRPKGGGFADLRALLENCRGVVAYGEAGPTLERDLGGTVTVRAVERFDDALALAAEQCRPGDVVLLSPACASFDQFSSYGERGDRFKFRVEAL